MANVNIVNEAVPGPSQAHDHYLMWRLTREMLNAGWVIVEASDGTTKTAGAGWTTLAESQNPNAWCALARPGNTTWGHLFWFRNVAGTFFGATPSAFQYYTITGWDTSASTPTTPPVAIGGTTYRVSGTTVPQGAKNWFGGEFAITNTHINIILKDDSASDDYSIIAWAMGTTNGSGAGALAMPCAFVWSIVDGPVDTTTGFGDPYVMLCHTENSQWEFAVPHAFGIGAWRSVAMAFENGTAAMLSRPNGASYLYTETDFNDIYESPSTKYLEPTFIVNLSGSKTYRGFAKYMRVTTVGDDGSFFDVANESGSYNWVKLPSSEMVLPWDGTTNQLLPYAAGSTQQAALMFASNAPPPPAPDVPYCTVDVPVADPCTPTAALTVTYGYAGGLANTHLTVYCYGDDGEDGPGALVYAGNPFSNTPVGAAPAGQFLITAQSDDGIDGTVTFEPRGGFYWPPTTCTWEAEIRSFDGNVSNDEGSRTIDVSLIPTAPTITPVSPAPSGSLATLTTPIVFTIETIATNNSVTTVSVEFANGIFETAYTTADGFSQNYAASSTKTDTSPTTDTFSLVRTTWIPGAVNVTVQSQKGVQNLLASTIEVWSLTAPGTFIVSDPLRLRQYSADVRAGDNGTVFACNLRTFDNDIPTGTGKSVRVRYSVNGAAHATVTGQKDASYATNGTVYFLLPDGTFANPGNVRVELALVDDLTGDAVTYPVDDTIYLFVSATLP